MIYVMATISNRTGPCMESLLITKTKPSLTTYPHSVSLMATTTACVYASTACERRSSTDERFFEKSANVATVSSVIGIVTGVLAGAGLYHVCRRLCFNTVGVLTYVYYWPYVLN